MIDMITAKDFRKALKHLVSVKAGLPYKVWFDYVQTSDQSYIWIDVHPQKTSWDNAYFQRILDVDIQVVLIPDEMGNVDRTDLLGISDKLDMAIMPCLRVKDRFITVQNFRSSIVDDVLHYEFTLDFTDYVPNGEYDGSNYELMKNLEVDLNKDTDKRVFFNENGDEE